MDWYSQLVGLFVLFSVLNTMTIVLRLIVRTYFTKGAFGLDDIALVFSYVGMILFIGFSLQSLHYGAFSTDEKPWHDTAKAILYYHAMSIVCFTVSGAVKISVALVLYRVENRSLIRSIIVFDIITCCIWTIFTTLLYSLDCKKWGLYSGAIDATTCANTLYSQDAICIFYDVFHVILAVYILWNVQISRGLKWSVVGLFGLGLLAAIAAALKLKNHYDGSHDNADKIAACYQAMMWAIVEHGLSIFASSILALRPLIKLVSNSWKSLSSTLYGSSKSTGQGSSRHSVKRGNWSDTTEWNELGGIGVQNEVSVRTENASEHEPQKHLYSVEAWRYTGCSRNS